MPMPSTRAPRFTISSSSCLGVEIQPYRDAEAIAQRRRQQPGPRGRADQREARQIDLHRARGGALADDEVELEILHRRIEDFLDRRIEPVDLVDEQDVAVLEIGQERREIARLGDHRAGGGAEIDAELARDDLRQRGLAEPRRADEQHMVERLGPPSRRLDEDVEVGARLLLADELRQPLRPQRGFRRIVVPAFAGHEATSGCQSTISSSISSRIGMPSTPFSGIDGLSWRIMSTTPVWTATMRKPRF